MSWLSISGWVGSACYDAGVCIFETTAVGISESKLGENKQAWKGANVARGVLFQPEASSHESHPASLLDVSGRKVIDLHPGANDVRVLAPGVYFLRET